MSKKDTKGLFIGKPHSLGGIPSEIVETGRRIEIEGDEYYICRDAYNSDKVHEFKSKTNKQVLDHIYANYVCELNQEAMNTGDFIVCKVVVLDESEKDRKGTISEILNEMQGEKSCRVENKSVYFRDGGFVCPVGTEIQTLIFHKSAYNKYQAKLWAKDHDFKHYKVSEYEESFRIRQKDPKEFTEDTFRTINLKSGVKAVIACPKNKKGNRVKLDKGGFVSDWFEGVLNFLNW